MASNPIPTTNNVIPSNIYVNQSFIIDVQFSNTGALPSDIGFVPAFDLIIPASMSIASLGTPLATWDSGTSQWLDSSNQPITVYPDYPTCALPTGSFNNGDQLFNILLGYSSYGPSQPTLDNNYTAVYNYAAENIPSSIASMSIQSRGIFFLGTSATGTSPPITGTLNSTPVNALQYMTTKTHADIVGDKQPTGPNYPVTYTVSTHIAPAQTFTNLMLEDALSADLRYIPGTVVFVSGPSLTLVIGVPPIGAYKVPGNNTIGNQNFIFNYNPITGAATTGTDIIITYQVYTDYYVLGTTGPVTVQTGLPYVLNASNPQNSITITNTVNVYEGATLLPANPLQTDQFPAGPYALSKAYNVLLNQAPTQPGDYIQYTMVISISDYFAFNDMSVADLVSCGQLFIDTTDPTYFPFYQVNNGTSIPFTSGEISQTEVDIITNPVPFDKYNQVTFTIPNTNLVSDPYLDAYKGGIFATETTGATDPPTYTTNPIDPSQTGISNPEETITITYYTQFQSTYVPFYPDLNVELADQINNTATVTGTSINIFNADQDPGLTGVAGVVITFPTITITKEIYAYNGVIGAFPVDGIINPGDILAYRTIVTFAFQNITTITWEDYLPLPLIMVANYAPINGSTITTSTPVTLGTPWTVAYGPTQTPHLNNGAPLNSVFSLSIPPNSITLSFGTLSDTPPYIEIVLDIIYTVQIGNQPFKFGLMFTNQSVIMIGNNEEQTAQALATTQFTIAEPYMDIKKTLVTGDPSLVAIFGNYGSASAPNLPATFDPNYFTNFTTFTSSSLIGDEQLRYAVLSSNDGTYPAFGVSIEDDLSAFLSLPTAGMVYVYKYDNTGATTLLVNGTDYTLTLGPNIIVTIIRPLSDTVPNILTLQTNEIYILIFDTTVAENIPDCGTITNTGMIDAYYNGFNNFDNFVGTVNSPVSTNNSTVVRPVLSPQSLTTGSGSGNTPATGFAPGELVDGSLNVTYPLGITNNITVTATINLASTSIVAATAIIPVGTIAGSNTVSANQWFNTSIEVDSGTGIVTYPFSFMIPTNAATGNYTISYNFQSIDGVNSCNINSSQPMSVATPTLSLSQCYTVVGNPTDNQVVYMLTVSNTGTNNIFNVNINDTVSPVLEIISVTGPTGTLQTFNPIIYITMIPPSTQYVYTITMQGILPPIPIGTSITNIFSSTLTYLPATTPVIAGPTITTTFTYTLPLLLSPNVADTTYLLHNSDAGTTTAVRGIVGAIGDVMQYTIDIGALANIEYSTLQLNFGAVPYPIDQLLLIPNTVGVLNTSGIPSLNPLTLVAANISGNQVITINFPNNSTDGYLITPPPTDNSQIYTILLPARIANHLYNQAGVAYNPIVTLTIYQNGIPSIINVNSGIQSTCSIQPPFNPDPNFTVIEPVVTIAKTFLGYTSPSTLNYSVVIQNTAFDVDTNEWVSSAFQMITEDDKFNDTSLFTSVDFTLLPSGWTDQTANLVLRAVMNVGNKLLPGQSITFNFAATYIPTAVLIPSTFTNISYTTYKSQLEEGTFSRTGADGPSTDGISPLNNYYVESPASITLYKPTIVKHILTPQNTTIGQVIQYAYVVTLPPGTNNNVVVQDIFGSNAFSAGYFTFGNTYNIVTLAADSQGLLTNDFIGTGTSTNTGIFIPASNELDIGFPQIIVGANNNLDDDSFVIFYSVTVASSTENILTVINTANISYSTQPVTPTVVIPGPEISNSSAVVNVVQPILYINKKVNSIETVFTAGQIVPYEIDVGHTNVSSMTAYNIVITDTPNGGTVVPSSVVVTSTCGPIIPAPVITAGPNLNIQINNLPLGCIYQITYNVLINTTTPVGNYTNTATLSYNNNDGTNPNPVTSTASATATVTIGAPIYAVSKTFVPNQSSLTLGGLITWNITYSNTGFSQITAPFTLTEPALPSFLTYVGTGWTGTGPFTFTDNVALNPGESRTIQFVVQIAAVLAGGTYTYNNIVTFGTSTASDQESVTVTNPQLTMNKAYIPGQSSLVPGGFVQWQITYSNTGESAAYDVVLLESILPSWLTFTGPNTWVGTGQGPFTYTDPVVLEPGQTRTVPFMASISQSLFPGIYTFTNVVILTADKQNMDGSFSPLPEIPSTATIEFVVGVTTITKHRLSSINTTTGEIIQYAYVVTLQPGINNNVVVQDIFNNNAFSAGYLSYNNTYSVVTLAADSQGLLTNDFNGTGTNVNFGLFSATNNEIDIGFPQIITASMSSSNDDSFAIFFSVTVVASPPNALTVTNTVNISYSQQPVTETTIVPGPLIASDTAIVNIVEPILYIHKKVNSTQTIFTAGQIVQYEIDVGHTSASSETGYHIVITDTPNGGTVVPGSVVVTSTCGPIVPAPVITAGPNLNVQISNLPLGCIYQITYNVQINITTPAGNYMNTATLSYDNNDGTNPNPVTSTGTATASITVGSAIYAVNKVFAASESSLVPGGLITWNITYSNTGFSQITAPFTLTEPATPIFLTYVGTGWTGTGPFTFTDNVALNPGESRTIQFIVQIASSLPSGTYTYNNIVTFGTSTASDQESIIVTAPQLTINKVYVAEQSSLAPGGFVQWQINYSNTGQSAAYNVVLTESVLPSWAMFTGPNIWVGTGQGPFTYTDPLILQPGQSRSVLFMISINQFLSPGTYTFPNIVTLNANKQNMDGSFSPLPQISSTDTIKFAVGTTLLTAAKTVDNMTPTVGDVITWTITLTNIGPSDLNNVVITEPVLPSWQAFDPSNVGWIQNINGTYTYNVGIIPLDQTIHIPYIVDIINAPPTNPTSYTNTATISYDDGEMTTASFTIQVNILKSVPYIYKTVNNTMPMIGDTVMWTIFYSNIGNYPTTSIVLTEPALPSWQQFVGPTQIISPPIPGWAGTGPYTYTDTVPLPAGQSRIVSFNVKIIGNPTPNPGAYTNTVSILMTDSFGSDPVISADSSFYINLTPANITVSKSPCCGKTTYNPGDIISWTITITNTGQSIATNVTASEPVLPSYLVFVGPNGWILQPDGSRLYTVGNVLPQQSIQIQYNVQVSNSITSQTNISYNNIVTVTSGSQVVTANSLINVTVNFDPLLTKTIINGSLKKCSKVTYRITFTNGGNTILTGPYTVYDLYPNTLYFDPAINPGWIVGTGTVPYVSYLILGTGITLAPGQSVSADIIFTVIGTPLGTPCLRVVSNIAQIYQGLPTVKPATDPIVMIITEDYTQRRCIVPLMINNTLFV